MPRWIKHQVTRRVSRDSRKIVMNLTCYRGGRDERNPTLTAILPILGHACEACRAPPECGLAVLRNLLRQILFNQLVTPIPRNMKYTAAHRQSAAQIKSTRIGCRM